MSNYTPLYRDIWDDAKFIEYTTQQQIIFIYLISNHGCKISGIYQISPKKISFSTNMDKNTVIDSLKSFDLKTLEYDSATGVVFVKNHFKYNLNKIGNPKTMIHSLLQSSSLTPHDEFWKEFTGKYNQELTRLIDRIDKFECKHNSSFLGQYLNKLTVITDCKQSDSSLDPDFIRVSISNSISNKDIKEVKEVKKSKKFIKPSLQEIKDYCSERKNSVDPEKFLNYYDSNGWKVGRNSMKNWEAAIRTWEKSSFSKPAKPQQSETSALIARVAQRMGEQDGARAIL